MSGLGDAVGKEIKKTMTYRKQYMRKEERNENNGDRKETRR